MIGQSVHVKMDLVVCGFSVQSNYATKVVIGVFVVGIIISSVDGAHQVLLYHF